jgi:putative phosphoesterase
MLIGVISDTHGRLDPTVEEVFAGVERIVHAGDVGDEAILTRLGAIAPLIVVRGNCDEAPWALALPGVASEVLEGVTVVVVHDRVMLDVYASPGLREAMSGGVGVLDTWAHALRRGRPRARYAVSQPRLRQSAALRAAALGRSAVRRRG